jgi:hypothetical protein
VQINKPKKQVATEEQNMYTIDDNQFPLILIQLDSPMSLTEAQQLFAYFEDVLAKAQPFVCIIASNIEGQHERGTAKLQKDWLKGHRESFGQYCAGLAMVTQSSRFIALYKLAAGQIIKRMYNCPGRLFIDLDEAKAWSQEQLGLFESSTR